LPEERAILVIYPTLSTAFYHHLTGLNLNSPGQLAAPWHGAHYRHSAQARNPSVPLFLLFYAVCLFNHPFVCF
jgi:hypothetical protein